MCSHVSPCCPQREHLLSQFRIQSQAWFNTSAMPYRVQPRLLPSGKAEVGLPWLWGHGDRQGWQRCHPPVPLQTETCVVRTSPGGEGAVPVGWVVLGVLSGLLLLTLLILLMWKVSGCRGTLGTSTMVVEPHWHQRDHETRDTGGAGGGGCGTGQGTAEQVTP